MKQWPKDLENENEFTNNKNTLQFDDVDSLKKEISNLEFVLYKYNLILSEYQIKYGNEIFAHLENLLNKEKNLNSNSEEKSNTILRKNLVENISLIKELEKNNLELLEKNDYLKEDLIKFQKQTNDIIKENSELREELEQLKEEHNKLYKSILDSNFKEPQNFADNEINNNNNSGNYFHQNKTSYSKGNNFESSNQNFYKTENNVNAQNKKDLFYTSAENFNGEQNLNFNNTVSGNNNAMNFLKNQNEELFNIVENLKTEEIQLKSAYNDIREKFIKINSENEDLSENYQKYKRECEELLKMKNFVEEKMKENNNQILINERKLNEFKSENETMKISNASLKERLNYYREQFEEIDQRKNYEIDLLMRQLSENKDKENTLRSKSNILEEENSNLKFDLNRIKNENSLIKYDLDHLTKVIEESNLTVKNAIEKERNLDMIIKSHKKKVDEAILEKDKISVKQNLLEKNLIKTTEDFNRQLDEKNLKFEEINENLKMKFHQLLALKDEELANLKADLFSNSIEKDKYYTEYVILKKEADKFNENFNEEIEKYIRKYEESERNALKKQRELNENLIDLEKRFENSEYVRNNLEKENFVFRNSEQERKNALDKSNKNDEFKTRELNKYKERYNNSIKEIESLNNEINKNSIINKEKMQKIKEKNELEKRILEDSLNFQKTQFDANQSKAFEMITEKYKEEYRSVVSYYESMVDNLVRENMAMKKKLEI